MNRSFSVTTNTVRTVTSKLISKIQNKDGKINVVIFMYLFGKEFWGMSVKNPNS